VPDDVIDLVPRDSETKKFRPAVTMLMLWMLCELFCLLIAFCCAMCARRLHDEARQLRCRAEGAAVTRQASAVVRSAALVRAAERAVVVLPLQRAVLAIAVAVQRAALAIAARVAPTGAGDRVDADREVVAVLAAAATMIDSVEH
jgi:hypothetical protein